MKALLLFFTLAVFVFRYTVESGFPCTLDQSAAECLCSGRRDEITVVVCAGIRNTSHLEKVIRPMKSMVVDRLLLVNAFQDYSAALDESQNSVDPKGKVAASPVNGILPKKWLSEVRVRDLEILNTNLNDFFLTDEAFEGQSEFLTTLVVRNSGLKGHLCGSCSSNFNSVSTKALRRVPRLYSVDFSHNQLEILDGNVFPNNLQELKHVNLSHNNIQRVNDNAFTSLHNLTYLDLSRNRISAISRKIFKPTDTALSILDLSHNIIQTIPENMFTNFFNLREVRLNHNIIEILSDKVFKILPTLLDIMDLTGNFVYCNCTAGWISRSRIGKQTKLTGYCVGPKNLEAVDFKNIPSSVPAAC